MNVEYLKQRRRGIGGSDIAAICGLSPWKSAYQVWAEKVGESAGVPDNPAVAYGRLMEPVIRQWYSDETGRTITVPNQILVHPKYDFALASLDGISGDDRVLEIKTARSGAEWGEPGTDEIPVYYQLQVQWYCMVMGYPVADVVVSVAGTLPVIYEVPSDTEIQEIMLERAGQFWEMVKNHIPPEPTTFADIVAKFGRNSRSQQVLASTECRGAIAELKAIKEKLKELESREEELKVVVCKEMGEADTLISDSGKALATWKLAKASNRLDLKTLQKDLPDTYDKYCFKSEPSRKFLIK